MRFFIKITKGHKGYCLHQNTTLCPEENVCINKFQICDGFKDCLNGFDEESCPSIKKSQLEKNECTEEYRFQCDKEFICMENVCDGKFDCLDGKDEAEICSNYIINRHPAVYR